ncbi:TM2 domain-containing protein [Bacillus paramobilis]|uniref:TM2 domain-containing protein n=1 Tax=Bacillus paramobilis TaxID=2817477 RepID=UPI001BB4052F|nr:TM2 domain-containing protein [Bacillus paramobilis]HEF5065779.1 TM2 domain-containing protein [Bacillus cereus]HEF5237763.1 TM2 domain-containing protein [Bacillus cereus]
MEKKAINEALTGFTTGEAIMFAKIYKERRYKKRIAFFIWIFAGALGIHRFYMRDNGVGTLLLLLTVLSCGIFGIIGVIDGVNIPRRVAARNNEIILETVKTIKKVGN